MIETSRLRLRRATSADVDSLLRTFGDASVMRFVGTGQAFDRDEVAAMIDRIDRRFEADGFGQLVVVRRADDRVIGRVGLLPLHPSTWRPGSRQEIGAGAEIEVGWTIERLAWGHGYAFEAAVGVVTWAHAELGLRRLISIIQFGNAASIRLAQKLGEQHEQDIVTSFGRPAHLYAMALRVRA